MIPHRRIRAGMVVSALQTGGVEHMLCGLTPHLIDRGVDVTVVSVTDRAEPHVRDGLAAAGADVVALHGSRAVDPGAAVRLRRLARALDVVHAHDQQGSILACLAVPATSTPLVLSRHVLQDYGSDPRRRARARLADRLARRSDRLIAVSDAAAQAAARRTGRDGALITTLRNGIDVGRFEPGCDRRDARRRLGWDPDRDVVTMVAVMRPVKAHEQLIAAAAVLAGRGVDVDVKLVGSGPREAELRDRARRSRAPVEFLGQRDDVPAVLAATDVLVLCSHMEALPNVLLEAGAAALPSVASDVGGTGEVVRHGVTGLLTEPGSVEDLVEALEVLLARPELRHRMGRAAHRWISDTFSYPAQAARSRAIYEELL